MNLGTPGGGRDGGLARAVSCLCGRRTLRALQNDQVLDGNLGPQQHGYSEAMELPFCGGTFPSVSYVFHNDSFLAEMAYEVKGYPEGNDILEKKQSQKAHIPHVAYSMNGNDRAGGRYKHRAGCKEHDRRDKSPYDTGFRLQIAYANQDGSEPLGETD